MQAPFLDWPAVIDSEATIQSDPRAGNLCNHWTHLEGVHIVQLHLCKVAAGLTFRPRRPERTVVFQPFSSRDAHIMLQLKRTLEIAKSPRLAILLKYALQAGKAARNVEKVPELNELRKYGNGKYSTQPPTHVLERVTKAAMDKAINPAVQACLDTFQANSESMRVSSFRSAAKAMASNNQQLQWIRRRLHEPTVKLRKGANVDTERILEEIQRELDS